MSRPIRIPKGKYPILEAALKKAGTVTATERQRNGKPKDWLYWGRRLTRVFNRWVRYRDTRPMPDGGRIGSCITCGKLITFEAMQACHYHPSQHLGTRWHEQNVNGGCVHCNKWLEGNRVAYAENLPKKWGKDVLRDLEVAKKLFARHPDPKELQEALADYTARVKAFES